jgi:hypothetical protein
MELSSMGGSEVFASIAGQMSAEKAAELSVQVNAKLLGDALETQKEVAAALLQSLGLGRNVDLLV